MFGRVRLIGAGQTSLPKRTFGTRRLRNCSVETLGAFDRSRLRELDLDIDAGRKVQLHQRIDGRRIGLNDVEQALVRTNFELLT